MKRILVIGAAVAALAFAMSDAEARHLTILSANDTHSMVRPDADGCGGLVRQKAIVDSVRQAEDAVVAVHAGDAVQGTVYFSTFKGEVEYAMLDSIGFDFCITGNHEFDNGMDELAKYYSNVRASKLSSNYDVTDTPLNGLLQPYVVKHFYGKRIAFMGINLKPTGMIADKNVQGLVFNDAATVALQLSEYLKTTGIADYVVMVSHIGYTSSDGDESDVEIAKKSRYIDLIIGGHSHTLVEPGSPQLMVKNVAGREVPVVQAGKYGKYMCKVNFDLDDGSVDYSLIPVDASCDSWASRFEALNAWLKPYDDEAYRVMHSRIATSARAMTNTELSCLPNFVCDAVNGIIVERWGKCDFAMMNRGGIRQPLPKGDVAEGMITSMLPFDNKLVVLKIKGSDLLDAFKVMTYRGGDAVSKAMDIKYKGHEIVWARLNGKDIEKDKYYTMVTIDYLANGGDYMKPLKNAQVLWCDDVPYGDLVLQYVKQLDARGIAIDAEERVRMHK
ncbi:MAG: bifunctional metallophosphatase/5'-nucleotidase [Muribaculaceae bacterium]